MTDNALATTNDDRSINAFSSEGAFTTAQRMAKALGASSLVPQEYRNNIPNVMIAMEVAARIGASVFAVMQNLDIIHGRPSFRSTFLIATVNASGRFSPLRYRFEGKPNTPEWGCRAYAKDVETGEECVGTMITIALARAEGWSSKKGSKWVTMPEQMLRYRAAAFWTRVYAPELSLGMHTREELTDVAFAGEASRGPRKLEQKLLQIHQPQAGDPEPADVVNVEPEPEPEPELTDPEDHGPNTGEVYGSDVDGK